MIFLSRTSPFISSDTSILRVARDSGLWSGASLTTQALRKANYGVDCKQVEAFAELGLSTSHERTLAANVPIVRATKRSVLGFACCAVMLALSKPVCVTSLREHRVVFGDV